MRILYLNLTFGFGGVERAIEGYAPEAEGAGYQIAYLTSDLTVLRDHIEYLRSHGAICYQLAGYQQPKRNDDSPEVVSIRKSLLKRWRQRLSKRLPENWMTTYHQYVRTRLAKERLLGWLQEVDPVADICHVHSSAYFEVAGLCRAIRQWRPDMTLIIHFHNGPEYFDPTYLERAMIRNASMCLFNSEYTRQAWEQWAKPRESMVSSNPIVFPLKTPPVRDLDASKVVLGWLGRLSPKKGVDTAIRAFARIADHFPRLRLEIAGDGSERERLEAIAESAGLGNRICFLGFVNDPGALLSRWHLLLQTTTTVEAFGRTVIEAAAHRCGVISTPVGGLAELIEDGVNGWLVPPGDEDALADRIVSVLVGAPSDYNRVVEEGYRRAQRYRAESITAELGNIYRSMSG
jgi:glycosyltransferase involved in cell wall biosynthesis